MDTKVGTSGNDTFDANEVFVPATGSLAATLTALDNIDGGDGIDTLIISDTSNTLALDPSVTVKNIENAKITGTGTVDGDVSAWTGLTSLTVKNLGGQATGISAAATTAVTLTDTALAGGAIIVDGGSDVTITSSTKVTAGTITVGGTTAAAGDVVVTSNVTGTGISGPAITVTGGQTVSVTQNLTSTTVNANVTAGKVDVVGDANTTTVTVTATEAVGKSATVAGIANDAVTVTDASFSSTDAGTITNVSVSGYTTLDIDASSVTDLSLANGSGNVTIDNSDAVKAPVETLNLTVDGLTGGTLDDADVYTTLNVTVNGDSTLADITSKNVTDLNVAGTAVLTLTSAAGLAGLTDVKVTGSAGLVADLSASAVAVVNLSGTSGDNAIELDATVVDLAVTGGSGADTITTTGALDAGAVIDLGDGDDLYAFDTAATKGAVVKGGEGNDTIAVVDGALLNAAAAAVYSGFETLEIAGGTGTYDMSILGLTDLSLTDTKLTGNVNITNATSATTLTFAVSQDDTGAATVALDNSKDFTFAWKAGADTGTKDAVSILLSAEDTGEDQTANGQVSMNIAQIDGIETLNITSNATTASVESAAGKGDELTSADYENVLTIVDASQLTKIVLSGNAQVDLTIGADDGTASTMVATVVSQIDASTNQAGVTVDMSALDADANATNDLVGVNTVGITFKGSDFADIYVSGFNGDTIQAGGGADDITLSQGTDTAGGGDDVVRYVAATDSQLTLTDTTADGVADTATGFDVVKEFNTAGTDIIELSSSLGLATGDARSAVLQKGAFAAGVANLEAFIDDGVDFFSTGLVDRAVAFANDGTDGYIFIDANKDGNFTQADDMVIQLAGVTTFNEANVVFG